MMCERPAAFQLLLVELDVFVLLLCLVFKFGLCLVVTVPADVLVLTVKGLRTFLQDF
jgi:hypothetical protein